MPRADAIAELNPKVREYLGDPNDPCHPIMRDRAKDVWGELRSLFKLAKRKTGTRAAAPAATFEMKKLILSKYLAPNLVHIMHSTPRQRRRG
jgi:hypothetical protein